MTTISPGMGAGFGGGPNGNQGGRRGDWTVETQPNQNGETPPVNGYEFAKTIHEQDNENPVLRFRTLEL